MDGPPIEKIVLNEKGTSLTDLAIKKRDEVKNHVMMMGKALFTKKFSK